MVYESPAQLARAFLESQRGRPGYRSRAHTASEWILTLSRTPTRKEIIARHKAKGTGDFEPGSSQANMELGLLRTIFRWGLYHECWEGGDPTVGIKKWKRGKRKRTGKFEELRKLLIYFDQAETDEEIRYRALFGLMLFTGCRPSEALRVKLDAITPYGDMGSWIKGKTKTGEDQELPLPTQVMPWIEAWKAIRFTDWPNPYLFPSTQTIGKTISSELARLRWGELRRRLGITGLWNYDLRRTLATSMSNELGYDDSTIRAILNHTDTSALGHYRFKSFDSLTKPIQDYADWLWKLKQAPKEGGVVKPKQHTVSIQATPPPPPTPLALRAVTVETSSKRTVRAPGLTGRECDVLTWFARGHVSPKFIAAQLGITAKTVQCYREHLMGKLQVKSTEELVRYAMEHLTDTTEPVPAQPAPQPLIAPTVVSQTMPAAMPMGYNSRLMEREEWPG